jgi:hypothetical protein
MRAFLVAILAFPLATLLSADQPMPAGWFLAGDKPGACFNSAPFILSGARVIIRAQPPNPPLNSDPARIAFRSLSTSGFLGSVQRLGAGGVG